MTKKIIFIQPALPSYRVDFFKRLSMKYGDDFIVHYAFSDLNIKDGYKIKWASCSGVIKNLLFGFFLQPGLNLNLSIGDIVVLSGNIRNLSSLRLFILSKLCGASVLWWGHYVSADGSRLGVFIRTVFMLFSDAVVFYVESEVHRFRASLRYCKYLPLTAALNNGLDITKIKEFRSKYVSIERDIDFIFIGRLTEKASVDIIIDAISYINKRITLHIIGDGSLKISLIERASNLGLLDQITWHGSVEDEESISALMNRSRVFVYAGGVGLSLIHAMAYGLPAILHSSSSNHMPEFDAFEEGVTGIAFERNNVNSLSEAMKYALNHPEELNVMSKNALARIGPDFTTEGMAQRFCELIDRLN